MRNTKPIVINFDKAWFDSTKVIQLSKPLMKAVKGTEIFIKYKETEIKSSLSRAAVINEEDSQVHLFVRDAEQNMNLKVTINFAGQWNCLATIIVTEFFADGSEETMFQFVVVKADVYN